MNRMKTIDFRQHVGSHESTDILHERSIRNHVFVFIFRRRSIILTDWSGSTLNRRGVVQKMKTSPGMISPKFKVWCASKVAT